METKTLIRTTEEITQTVYCYTVKVKENCSIEEAKRDALHGNYVTVETREGSRLYNADKWHFQQEEQAEKPSEGKADQELPQEGMAMFESLKEFHPVRVDLQKLINLREGEFLDPDICDRSPLSMERYAIIQRYMAYLSTDCLTDRSNYYFLMRASSFSQDNGGSGYELITVPIREFNQYQNSVAS